MTKILLVEDDGQIASYLGELLRAEGFDTQIAGSKKEAGECLLAQAFDLVLLDVSLPDGNGFSVCAEIKREYEMSSAINSISDNIWDEIKTVQS